MTNEQCIAVVEKVWGLSLQDFSNRWEIKSDFEDVGTLGEYVYKRVNSWQGFGRTVEAMRPNFQLLLREATRWPDYGSVKTMDPPKNFIATFKGLNKKGYVEKFAKNKDPIEATHLAALEAVRQEKE